MGRKKNKPSYSYYYNSFNPYGNNLSEYHSNLSKKNHYSNNYFSTGLSLYNNYNLTSSVYGWYDSMFRSDSNKTKKSEEDKPEKSKYHDKTLKNFYTIYKFYGIEIVRSDVLNEGLLGNSAKKGCSEFKQLWKDYISLENLKTAAQIKGPDDIEFQGYSSLKEEEVFEDAFAIVELIKTKPWWLYDTTEYRRRWKTLFNDYLKDNCYGIVLSEYDKSNEWQLKLDEKYLNKGPHYVLQPCFWLGIDIPEEMQNLVETELTISPTRANFPFAIVLTEPWRRDNTVDPEIRSFPWKLAGAACSALNLLKQLRLRSGSREKLPILVFVCCTEIDVYIAHETVDGEFMMSPNRRSCWDKLEGSIELVDLLARLNHWARTVYRPIILEQLSKICNGIDDYTFIDDESSIISLDDL